MPSCYPANQFRVVLYEEARVHTSAPPWASPPASASGPVPPENPLPLPPAVKRRVLVVDDEPTIRSALARYLRRRGWDADEAEDGQVALRELGHSAPEKYQVVISDLRMPHCTGVELHDWLAQHRPDLFARLIITTGDLASPAWSAFVSRTPRPLIEKPFELAVIAQLIDAVARGR